MLAVEGRGGADEEGDRSRSDFEYAESSRSLAVALGGTSLAVLTFFLFFGYDRAVNGQIDPDTVCGQIDGGRRAGFRPVAGFTSLDSTRLARL